MSLFIGSVGDESAGTTKEISVSKYNVDYEVGRDENSKESRPGNRKNPVIQTEGRPQAQSRTPDVKGPIFVEQALTAFTSNNRSEAQIA